MDDRMIEQAIAWHAAQMRDDCDWDGFTQWLEADPQHRAVYDDIALLDGTLSDNRELLGQLFPAEPAVAPEPAATRSVRRWAGYGFGGAIAAAAAMFAVPMMTAGPAQIAYETGPGQTRMVTLADGTQVALASSSRLLVAKDDKNDISIEGAAWFSVPHNPLRTLVIRADGYRISDIGTRFEVKSVGERLTVAVADGSLSVGAGGLSRKVQLHGGQRLMVARDIGLAEVGNIDGGDVASWRSGRLVYQDVPLSLVATDLSRYAGKNVVADPAIARRRFSGVLSIGDGSGLVKDISQIMGLAVRPEGNDVRLVDRAAAG